MKQYTLDTKLQDIPFKYVYYPHSHLGEVIGVGINFTPQLAHIAASNDVLDFTCVEQLHLTQYDSCPKCGNKNLRQRRQYQSCVKCSWRNYE